MFLAVFSSNGWTNKNKKKLGRFENALFHTARYIGENDIHLERLVNSKDLQMLFFDSGGHWGQFPYVSSIPKIRDLTV